MVRGKKNQYNYDPIILVTTLFLTGIGLVAVFSSSSILAAERYGDHYYYLKRQAIFCLFGFFLMIVAKNINYLLYKKLAILISALSLILLILPFVPGIGVKVGGATRWIQLYVISFQPSEAAKLSLAVFIAYSMSKNVENMRSLLSGLVPNLIIVAIFMVLILKQPDLGTAAIIGTWMLILLFIGGANLGHLIILLGLLAPVVFYLIVYTSYRLDRVWAFLNPWQEPEGIGFQIINSFIAFGSGGLTGVGLGDSMQKLFYLPEPHTDFIFSIIAEEMGFIGVIFLLLLFSLLVFRGIKIALNAPELFGSYLALGITFMLALQVVVNMGVAMAILPTKGLTLPFISYGGSSLIINLVGAGILMNISKTALNRTR